MKIVKQFCPPSIILVDSPPSTAPCFRFTKLDTSGLLLADSDESESCEKQSEKVEHLLSRKLNIAS